MGTVFTDFGPGNDESGGQIFRLSNQKILQVGRTSTLDSSQFALARFNADGSNDNDFGPDGDGSNQVTASLPSEFTVYTISAINAVAVNPNTDQIVVVGTASEILDPVTKAIPDLVEHVVIPFDLD